MIKKKLCAFFQTQKGCKKKNECDFSHDISSGDRNIIKNKQIMQKWVQVPMEAQM